MTTTFTAVCTATYSSKNDGTIVLSPLAGEIPNRNFISPVIADSLGLEPGRAYITVITETRVDATYGPQYNYSTVGLTGLELAQNLPALRKDLGQPKVTRLEDHHPFYMAQNAALAAKLAKVEAVVAEDEGAF